MIETRWMDEHRENVRDVIQRCMTACLEELRPGFTAVVREAAERTLLDWPDNTPPAVRAFGDEETRRIIGLILPHEAPQGPPAEPRAPHRGQRP
ncbi:hypothetical protein [Stappia sp.]|uniref:hypothetical protein n=1 Tax=Stappia sp. TaxID=1870903 RepID=UPI003D1058B7